MIETVASVGLPIDETLEIRKRRICPKEGGEGMRRISIVTGIHGDELEGQYACFEIGRRIEQSPGNLTGIVDLYPAMNPLGIDSITRGIPAFDLDMNRLFPGNVDGNMTEYIAAQIMRDVAGSDLVVDIHASNIYLMEIPQIRINELHEERLVPLAREANVDLVWVHGASTVLESTFAYSLNSTGTPCLVVEMGVGMRITKEYGDQLTDGIFRLMEVLGIWKGRTKISHTPVVSSDPEDVSYLNAGAGGLFLPDARHGEELGKGERIGRIVHPLSGKVLEEVHSPVDGVLFTIREYPIVEEGSLVGRILRKEAYREGAFGGAPRREAPNEAEPCGEAGKGREPGPHEGEPCGKAPGQLGEEASRP